MGKQGKRSKSRTNELSNTYTVSILTPTSKRREKCMTVLSNCINQQTFLSKIKQWVIVSGDKDWNKEDFENMIDSLQHLIPSHIHITAHYLTHDAAQTMGDDYLTTDYEAIGYLRNVTNLVSTGDYLVCMDDDDYYPPSRVEHAVSSLAKSHKLVAGCSNHIMYDVDTEGVYQFKRFGLNHSINNILAYKREYLVNGNTYVSTKKNAEEVDFLRRYQSPMIQLDPQKSVVQMCHANNTFNKRKLIVHAAWMPKDKSNVFKISSTVSGYIPQSFLDNYRKSLGYSETEISEYDLVYYTGTGAPQWSPYDSNLGGSEQAVKHLAESWAKMGLKVAVYGDFSAEITKLSSEHKTGVAYLNYADFKCSLKYKTIILWRYYGIHPTINWPLKADKILLDVHDGIPLHRSCIDQMYKVYGIMVRSEFHKHKLCETHKNCDDFKDKFIVIPNGVRVADFTPKTITEREPFRFCWCSCYTRGLANILAWVWPIIKYHEPRAEFHVYYGMNSVNNEFFKTKMTELLAQPGVIDHGRQNVDAIIKEKQKSSYHLYYSCTNAETDCISLRESACAGCIPIISKHGIFNERSGIHIDGDANDHTHMKMVGAKIVDLIKPENGENIEKLRKSLVGNEINWDKVAERWKQYLGR